MVRRRRHNKATDRTRLRAKAAAARAKSRAEREEISEACARYQAALEAAESLPLLADRIAAVRAASERWAREKPCYGDSAGAAPLPYEADAVGAYDRRFLGRVERKSGGRDDG